MVFQAVDIPTHKSLGDVDFGITGAPDFCTFNQSKCTVRQCCIVIGQKFGKTHVEIVTLGSSIFVVSTKKISHILSNEKKM